MKRSEIEKLLPVVFQRTVREGSPLSALLDAMEALHRPSESVLEQIDTAFDPHRCPDHFVPFLAGWVDLQRLFPGAGEKAAADPHSSRPISTGLGRLRELIAAAAYLSRWRGTAKGLLLFLETATGERGFRIDERVSDEGGSQAPFHVRVHAPVSTRPHRELMERIIELEKPAYVTYELVFDEEPVPAA